MSYNISRWITKKIKNLEIPIEAFFTCSRQDFHPKIVVDDVKGSGVTLECGCEQNIRGILKEGMLYVTEFDMAGEGSGTFWNYVLGSVLKESKGELKVVIIWEGGDTIERLHVKDGIIEIKRNKSIIKKDNP